MMESQLVNRRGVLIGGSVAITGCLNRGATKSRTVTDETDGYPPHFETKPRRRSIDTSSFSEVTVDGTAVPLAPIAVSVYWYRRREVRVADARGHLSYERSHIRGAVLSPAPNGRESDPVKRWPTDDRILCYCGCPHHLSAIRAAHLIDNGYENVFVLDEGFWEWYNRGYPVTGNKTESKPAVRRIRGRTDPAYSGTMVWAWHEPSGYREAAPIESDGTYVLTLRSPDLSPKSTIVLETPAERIRAPVSDLVDGSVTGAATNS